mmetsp:Transcript_20549/g.82134  ORF Transcript_20549/g.82134 Transcript_20549/m.82134 type:complete len:229 (-) Transcript_20549:50-736(-)
MLIIETCLVASTRVVEDLRVVARRAAREVEVGVGVGGPADDEDRVDAVEVQAARDVLVGEHDARRVAGRAAQRAREPVGAAPRRRVAVHERAVILIFLVVSDRRLLLLRAAVAAAAQSARRAGPERVAEGEGREAAQLVLDLAQLEARGGAQEDERGARAALLEGGADGADHRPVGRFGRDGDEAVPDAPRDERRARRRPRRVGVPRARRHDDRLVRRGVRLRLDTYV